jgi:hypothetical protein
MSPRTRVVMPAYWGALVPRHTGVPACPVRVPVPVYGRFPSSSRARCVDRRAAWPEHADLAVRHVGLTPLGSRGGSTAGQRRARGRAEPTGAGQVDRRAVPLSLPATRSWWRRSWRRCRAACAGGWRRTRRWRREFGGGGRTTPAVTLAASTRVRTERRAPGPQPFYLKASTFRDAHSAKEWGARPSSCRTSWRTCRSAGDGSPSTSRVLSTIGSGINRSI